MVREWLEASELPKMTALETMILDWLVDGGECEGITDEDMISVIPTLPPVRNPSIVRRVNEGASTSGLNNRVPSTGLQTGEGQKRTRDIEGGDGEGDIRCPEIVKVTENYVKKYKATSNDYSIK